MGANSSISWTHHTFNPWWGCTRVEGSPACDECYAEDWAARCGYGPDAKADKFPIWGAHEQRRFFGDKHWAEPLRWNSAAHAAGESARVFCASMADWAEGRPDQVASLQRLWGLIHQTPHLYWLMLTKRPQLIRKLCPLGGNQRVWQGVTAETQKWLDLRAEHLRDVESVVYWLSVEPMFEALRLPQWFMDLGPRGWVICGGESGSRATPIDPDSARNLRDQCRESGVRFHMKQMSGRTKAQLEAIPEDLMIRQYPEAESIKVRQLPSEVDSARHG